MSDIDVPLEQPEAAPEAGFQQMRLIVTHTEAVISYRTHVVPADTPELAMTKVTATGLGTPEEITFGVLHRPGGVVAPVAGDEIEVSVRWGGLQIEFDGSGVGGRP